MLPLRLFLGVTFAFAGLQKLADPHFLDPNASGSIHAQLRAAALTSPIGGLLGGLVHQATAVGVAIAIAELAVGVGALLGLWTRVAAAGGLALSIGFLLTVSWHSHPYYLGPDIAFAAAWTPLLLAGAGDDPRLSLDTYLRRRTNAERGVPDAQAIPIAFATVQRLCGGYDAGRCRYQSGRPCAPERCPVLVAPALEDRAGGDRFDRRTFLSQARVAAALVVGGTFAAASVAGIGRTLARHGGDPVAALPPTGGSSGTANGTGGRPRATGPGTPGTPIGPASAVPVGGVASFDDPGTGSLAYVVQPTAGTFQAFSSVCPHAGCQVGYSRGANEFVCPCHGARFDGTGGLLQGPAQTSLSPITVARGQDGRLYVDG
jgi:thiosulfate dehydrogenase (quinone) large subunit